MIKRNKGFTMIELVVVMAIIAILVAMLVPAVNRARKKAAVNKAQAEMAALASTGGMIKLDTGEYVRLGDYEKTDADADVAGNIRKYDGNPTTTDPITSDVWDGPYTTYQPDTTYTDGAATDAQYNAPLDSWNKFYWLGYNSVREIMVIYSAGPDGKFSTNITAPIDPDPPAGDIAASDDDLLYKFK